jgi:hypothetical protein
MPNRFMKNPRKSASLPCPFKGTQDWDFFWLRFWNLQYFFVSYVNILKFCKKNFWIGPLLGEVRFFRVVLRLRRMKKNFELGQNFLIFFFIYEPFIWANISFSKIWSINCVREGFMCWSGAKMSNFIPLSLRLSEIEFSLVSDLAEFLWLFSYEFSSVWD